jgi:hypothetical protein
MKTTGCFFAFVFVLVAVCKGSELGAVRIDFTDPMFSKLDDQGRDVMREYANAYPKVKDFYRNLRMDVTKKVFRHTASDNLNVYIPLKTPPILRREELFEVRYNSREGGFSRVDSQIKFIQGQDAKMYYARQVDLFTPDFFYGLSKDSPNNQFYSLDAKHNREKFESTVGVVSLEFDNAPFTVGPMPAEHILFQPPYFAKDVPYFIVSAQYSEAPNGLVEIVSCIEENSVPTTMWTIRLLRESWAIKDILHQGRSNGGIKFWHRHQCEYDGEFEGMPLLSSYQINRGIYDTDEAQTKRLITQVRYDVTKLVPGPPDLSEFDVTQFLPPGTRVGEITSTTLSPAWIAAIVIGIIFATLGIYLKMRKMRMNRK